VAKCSCHSHSGFLTRKGIRVAQQTSLEGLAPRGELEYIDRSVSVSALTGPEVHWDDALLEEQHRRFLSAV